MSDSPFQRPGEAPRPASETWPYEWVSEEEPTPRRKDPPSHAGDPPVRQRGRGRRLWIVSGVAGFLVGGISVGALSALYFADPEPLPITVDIFPEYILGLERLDIGIRASGDVDAAAQFEAELESQVESHRFSYGGDGAALHYEGGLALTIVNGRLAPELPTDDRGEFGNQSPRLVSLDTGTVSCVFQAVVGLYDGAVLEAPRDLSASGLTDCVLVDEERNLSLRLANAKALPGDAVETATEFAGVLERTHAGIVD